MSPSGQVLVQQLGDEPVQPHGEDGAATVDADDGDLAVGVAFDDLVSDPHECAAHGLAVEDDLFRSL